MAASLEPLASSPERDTLAKVGTRANVGVATTATVERTAAPGTTTCTVSGSEMSKS